MRWKRQAGRKDNPYERTKSDEYKKIMGFVCMSPDCKYGYGVDSHHIFPLNEGGEDMFWNLINLCAKCHRGAHHRKQEGKELELFTWKCTVELAKLGFVLDEREDKFEEHYRITRVREKEEYYGNPKIHSKVEG